MVEPAGFEPATFPVSPGRAQQLLDEALILLLLDLRFASNGLTPGSVLRRVNELPWTAVLQCKRVVGVVAGDSLGKILSLSYVVAPARFALKNVDVESHAR